MHAAFGSFALKNKNSALTSQIFKLTNMRVRQQSRRIIYDFALCLCTENRVCPTHIFYDTDFKKQRIWNGFGWK